MAHRGFAKVGKWKTAAVDSVNFGKAGTLGMLEEVFGEEPEELFLLTGKVKHADLAIQVIGDQAGVYVIDGDLSVTGTLSYNQLDGGSALYITGKLECGNLALGSEANLWVGGDLTVKKLALVFTGDAGSVIVGGKCTVDTWIEGYGRGTHELGKKPAIKTFVRWSEEELAAFPTVTPASIALAEAFVERGSFEAMTKALAKGKPLLASAAERKQREHAAKAKAAAANATAELDLASNNPKAIPATVFKKPLRKLTIGGWNLKKIPAELGTMSSLQELVVQHSDVKALPASLGKLANLRVLEVRSCSSLSELPASLVDRNAITELGWGPLRELPPVITKLTNLEKLSLWGESSCRMTAFPTEIVELRKLRSLTLRWHQFPEIPDALLELQDLEELDLLCALGYAKRVPDLSKLPKLRTLYFSGAPNGATGDPDADPALLDAVHDLANLEHLKLTQWKRWKPLAACLDRVATFPKLVSIDLFGCPAGGLPDKLLAKPTLQRVTYREAPPLDRERYVRDYPKIQFDFS
jgi:hypothetical protein